jgi:hypothetical protein
VSGPTKARRDPWHAEKHEREPRKSRVDAATEILGEDQRSDVEVVLNRMDEKSEGRKDIRFLDSRRLKSFAKLYGAALDKVIALMERAPAALRTPLGMGYIVPELGIGTGKRLFDKRGNLMLEGEVFPSMDELLWHLRVVRRHCRYYESSKVSQKQQKATADDKRLAAWGALVLCEKHGIRPTQTKDGRFCRLAAALYGTPRVNFLPHCQSVLKKREAWQKAANDVREQLEKLPAELREAWQITVT